MLKTVGFIGLGQMGKWMALNSGWGHEDKGAMIKVFENALGVKFRKS